MEGARELLREQRLGAVLFEVGTRGAFVMDCLKGQGFCLFAIGPHGILHPMKASDLGRDVNAVALHESKAGSNLVLHDADRL